MEFRLRVKLHPQQLSEDEKMKFKFLLEEHYRQVVEIEAESHESAVGKVEEMLDSGGVDLSVSGDRVTQTYTEL